jgi:antitoxin component of RelBE/YafQ-DinJ toxin-antitoxin module
VRQGKIPFEISLPRPNATTLAAMKEIEDMRAGTIPKQSSSVADFVKEMGI